MLNGLAVGDPFFHRLGASVSERTFCDSGSSTAYLMTVGPTAGIDPESFVHSKYIVIWACNLMSTNIHMWKFVAEAQKRGAKVVVIDPLRTRTAKRADWHIAIRPGTDAALALGMAHVLVRDGLIDHDYVREHTVGFGELAERLAEYPPERVARITGVPAGDIERLATEYATTQPAAIRIGVAVERHASGGQAVRAITSLPALTGAWRNVGGGVLQLSHWAFPLNIGAMHRPDWIPARHARRQPVAARIGPHRRARARSAGTGALRLQRQPRHRRVRPGADPGRPAARGPVLRRG